MVMCDRGLYFIEYLIAALTNKWKKNMQKMRQGVSHFGAKQNETYHKHSHCYVIVKVIW